MISSSISSTTGTLFISFNHADGSLKNFTVLHGNIPYKNVKRCLQFGGLDGALSKVESTGKKKKRILKKEELTS
jgi:hypothetical protein